MKKIPVARPKLPGLAALAPYIERIDEARWYSNFGPLCEAFEARLAERFGLRPDGVCTMANATVGLALALGAAGAKRGTLCIVPSWTFSASVHAVIEAGLTPYLTDVDEGGLLTPEIVREALANAPGEVGAIMPVAVCGQPVDPQVWVKFRQETGIPVVLDAAPGFDGARPGDMMSVVSLHATKVLGVGEGGFALSRDPDLVADVRQRANFGFRGSRIAQMAGTNGKLSEYAAAIGLAALDEWPARRTAFQKVAARYRQNLGGLNGARFLDGWGPEWISTTCVVQIDRPEWLMTVLESLHGAGVETRAWWGRGMHTHPAFAGFARRSLPMTAHLAETVLGLPFSIDMPDEHVDIVCGSLREGLARCS